MLTSCCEIPQHTFTGLMESMPQWLRVVLVAQQGATQYWAGGFNVMAEWGVEKIEQN